MRRLICIACLLAMVALLAFSSWLPTNNSASAGQGKGGEVIAKPTPTPKKSTSPPSSGSRPGKQNDAARCVPKAFTLHPQPVVRNGNLLGMELVQIPPGSFCMGSDKADVDQKPMHRVTISHVFYMGKYEVQQVEWQRLMGDNPSSFKDCGGNCPVENVSWDDAQRFIDKLNTLGDGFTLSGEGYTYRLPTEAEWEYVCRAGTITDNAGSWDSVAWYSSNSGTHAVGTKQANAFGLYDMHGNVWEWCQDFYDAAYYRSSPGRDPQGPSSGQTRVLRGGSWNNRAALLGSAFRSWNLPDYRVGLIGFRVVAVARTQ